MAAPAPDEIQPRGQGHAGQVLGWVRCSGVVALVAMAVWAVGDAAIRHAPNPAQLNFVEGFVVADAQRVAAGGPLYNDPREVPFTVNVYTPLYTLLLAGLARLGADPFLAGRLLSLASMAAVAAVVAAAGWRRSRVVAMTAASLFLLAPLQWPWSLVVRPDALAVALSVAAVALAATREDGSPPWTAWLLAVAAVFAKQTAAAACAALVLSGLRRRPRRALAAVAVGGFAAALVAAVLQWASGGWFLFHTVSANLNPFSWERAAVLALAFLRRHSVEMAVLVGLLATRIARRRLGVVELYAVLACLAAASVGKAGSDLNYFVEPLAAAALLSAHAWPVTPPLGWRVQPGAGVALLVSAVWLGAVHLADQRQRREPFAAAAPLARQLAGRLQIIPGLVVSDDATLLLRAGKPVVFQPFVMKELAEAGRWDEGPFLAALQDGRVGAVVVQSAPAAVAATRYTAGMRQAIATNFRPAWGFVLGFPYTVHERLP